VEQNAQAWKPKDALQEQSLALFFGYAVIRLREPAALACRPAAFGPLLLRDHQVHDAPGLARRLHLLGLQAAPNTLQSGYHLYYGNTEHLSTCFIRCYQLFS
jgi:hypothetical protein